MIQAVKVDARGGDRDLALLSLMFNTGARVSEIVGVQNGDLRLTAPCSVLLRGKGQKERTCSALAGNRGPPAKTHRATEFVTD